MQLWGEGGISKVRVVGEQKGEGNFQEAMFKFPDPLKQDLTNL